MAGRAAAAAMTIFLGMGTVAVGTAAAAPAAPALVAPADLPSYWWRDGIVREVPGGRVNVWADRRTDSFLCSWAGGGCDETATRPATSEDRPVGVLRENAPVTVECYKGTYYMLRSSTARLGWVPKQAINVGENFVNSCAPQD